MKVKAIRKCKYDGKHRKIDDIFDVTEEIYEKHKELFKKIEIKKDTTVDNGKGKFDYKLLGFQELRTYALERGVNTHQMKKEEIYEALGKLEG